MAQKYLTIMEVSQKQAFIFASNRLKKNVENSNIIAWIMDPEYFEQTIADPALFTEEKNLVYSGGGHTVLQFDSKDTAKSFTSKITKAIHDTFVGVDVFACTIVCENDDLGKNLEELTKTLERKKSVRKSAFHQGSFGIEKIDSETLLPELSAEELKKDYGEGFAQFEKQIKDGMSYPGYREPDKLEELGGSRDVSNFIAVVHIDGNAMGKRVENLTEKEGQTDWEAHRKKRRTFSESIDHDFKESYKEMVEEIVKNLENGNLGSLDLRKGILPIRRLITAGDDICFVTEGRIGIECANIFIQKLNKKTNAVDHEGYMACAGVAIVHRKYPFYKAYELAEMLCSNAKKFGANIDKNGLGKNISALDWHIEFGEIKDTLEEIRSSYQMKDGGRLELRPYIVSVSEELKDKETIRLYKNFRELIRRIQSEETTGDAISYARNKLKNLRSVLKGGEEETYYYMKVNHIEQLALESYYDIYQKIDYSRIGTGEGLDGKVFAETADGVRRSLLFDAIEAVDTYVRLDTE